MWADGLQYRCRDCQNAAVRASAARQTPEQRREKSRRDQAWRKAKLRDGRLNKAERDALAPIRQKERMRRYLERHAERLAYEKAVRRDNRLNPAEARAKYVVRKAWQRKQWGERHPEQDAIYRHTQMRRRRGRKLGAAGKTSTRQLRARWDYYGGRCWMCGAVATETDHVIALAQGGSEWPANLRPACAPCNRRKNGKPLAEVLAATG